MTIKKIENYNKPKVLNKKELFSSKNIVSVISIGLLTFTISCSSNVKIIEHNPSPSDSLLQTKPDLAKNDLNKSNSVEQSGSIKGNYPNPFMPTTSIIYEIKNQTDQPDSVNVSFYNPKGELVRTLINDFQKSGTYHFDWDGKDDHGNKLESGIYYYKLVINGKEISVRKVVLMK